MKKETLEAKLAALDKLVSDNDQKVKENTELVIGILERYKRIDATGFHHMLEIEKYHNALIFTSVTIGLDSKYPTYTDYNSKKAEAIKNVSASVRYVTENGMFDGFMEYLLDTIIPNFIFDHELHNWQLKK